MMLSYVITHLMDDSNVKKAKSSDSSYDTNHFVLFNLAFHGIIKHKTTFQLIGSSHSKHCEPEKWFTISALVIFMLLCICSLCDAMSDSNMQIHFVEETINDEGKSLYKKTKENKEKNKCWDLKALNEGRPFSFFHKLSGQYVGPFIYSTKLPLWILSLRYK